MATNSKTIRSRIEAGKEMVRDKYAICKVAARKLSSAYLALADAEENRDIKNTSKAMTRCAVAENTLNAAKKEFISFATLYNTFFDDVIALYDELIATENARGAKKARAEAEKYEAREAYLKDKLFDMVKDVDGISDIAFETKKRRSVEDVEKFEDYEDDGVKAQEKSAEHKMPEDPQPNQAPPHVPPYYSHPYDAYRPHISPQPVNIAPASIDISGVVEDAVASALEKFKAVFNKRVDEFIKENPYPVCTTEKSEGGAAPGAVLAMEEQIAEDEGAIVEKLKETVENLQKISDTMIELGASYIALSNATRDAVEAQRKVNDMQRSIARELQGVQANQKVINQDQATVTAEQAALAEKQKANIENQKLIAAEQAALSEAQKSLTEAQAALDASIKEIVASQKNIITGQQSIIGANSKNIELQKELAARQAELNTLQKSIMSEHKQLSRSVRSKVEEKKPRETKVSKAAEKIVNESVAKVAEQAQK